MSTLTSYASAAARDSAAPAASNTGLCIFRSDTKAIEVSDGTNYLTYNNDGITYDFSASNSYSGEFDGTADHIDFGTSEFDYTSNFSISGFFKQDDTGFNTLIGRRNGNDGYIIYLNSGGLNFFANGTNVSFGGSINTTSWYHFVITHTGSIVTCYLDGSLLSSGSSTIASAGSTNFYAGRNNTAGAYYLNGLMDEIAVFDRVLTSNEASDIYNNKIYVGPVALWRLENDVTDETGNYDGTNNGVTFSTTDKPY